MTKHDETVYDIFHQSGAISYYSYYRDLAAKCQQLFQQKDQDGLRTLLSASSKYRFIINQISREPQSARILEIGSSRGYLTSCFILEGRNILAVDISGEAVDAANSAFGDYFVGVGDSRIKLGGPFDLVYHVGMIGCVSDPVGLTRQLIGMLKPGGKLVFNAPNRQALHLRDQLWFDSAPPPDLVTLFPPGFWKSQFSVDAVVTEEVETTSKQEAFLINLRILLGRSWQKPEPALLELGGRDGHTWSQMSSPVARLVERVALKVAKITGLNKAVPTKPFEFGLFVTMIKKDPSVVQ